LNRIFYNWKLRLIKELTDPKGMTLDIGCGDKRYTKYLPNAVGIDVADSFLNIENKHDIRASGTHLPFRNGIFQQVHGHESFEHIDNVQKVFAECYRVLKENGSFVILSPNKFSYIIARIIALKVSDLFADKQEVWNLNERSLLKMLNPKFRLEEKKWRFMISGYKFRKTS